MEFIKKLSKFAADILGKPESYVTVILHDEAKQSWNGTFDPAYVIKVISLGGISAHKNILTSQTMSIFLNENLGVQPNRGYIVFEDPGRDNLGWDGTTFGA